MLLFLSNALSALIDWLIFKREQKLLYSLSLNKFLVSYFEIFTSLFSCHWLIALFTRVICRETVIIIPLRIRSSRQEVFRKKGGLRKTPVLGSLFLKKALAQVFSCEFCEMSKNTISYRTPLVAASGVSEWIYTLHF